MDLIDSKAVGVLEVGLNSMIQALGDALAVFRFFQPLFIGGIGNKGDFGQHGWHVGADQNHEGSFTNSAAPVSAVTILQALRKGFLNGPGKITGFPDFFVSHNLLQDVLEIMDPVFRESIFARGNFHGVARPGEIQVVRFDSSRLVIRA